MSVIIVAFFAVMVDMQDYQGCTTNLNWPALRQVLANESRTVLCSRVGSYCPSKLPNSTHMTSKCHRVYIDRRRSPNVVLGNSSQGNQQPPIGLLTILVSVIPDGNCASFASNKEHIDTMLQIIEGSLLAAERSVSRASLDASNSSIRKHRLAIEFRELDSCFSASHIYTNLLDIAWRSVAASGLCGASQSEEFNALYYQAIGPFGSGTENASLYTSSNGGGPLATPQVVILPENQWISTAPISVLDQFKIPWITYGSAAATPPGRQMHQHHFVAGASIKHDLQAMAALLKVLGLKYVHVLMGIVGSVGALNLQHFYNTMLNIGLDLCIAHAYQFNKEDPAGIQKLITEIILSPNSVRNGIHTKPSVIILLSDLQHAERIFITIEMLARGNDTRFGKALRGQHYVWLANDAWAHRAVDIVFGRSGIGNHTVIGFEHKTSDIFDAGRSRSIAELHQQLSNLFLTRESVLRDPWLGLLWQDRMNCSFRFVDATCDSSRTAQCCCSGCIPASQVFDIEETRYGPTITSGSLLLAVEAAASALNVVRQHWPCTDDNASTCSLSAALRSARIPCSSVGLARDCQAFNNFQEVTSVLKITSTGMRDGKLKSLRIGNWTSLHGVRLVCDGHLHQDTECKRFIFGSAPPVYACSPACKPGQLFIPVTDLARRGGSPCCWECVKCYRNAISTTTTSRVCTPCPKGWESNAASTECLPRQVVHKGFGNPIGVVVTLASLVGAIAIVLTAVVFYTFRDHDIVQEAGGKQNIPMLLVLFMAFVNAVYLLQVPTTFFCVSSSVSTAGVLITIKLTIVTRSCRLLAKGSDVPSVCKRIGGLLAKTAKRQVIFLSIANVVLGVVPHFLLQHITPHRPEVINLNGPELHVVCQMTALFQNASTLCIFFVVVAMAVAMFASRNIKELSARPYPVVKVKTTRERPSRENAIVSTKQLSMENKLVLFAGSASLVLYCTLTPTFLLTVRILWPLIIAVSLFLEGLAIWLCLYAPRLHGLLRNARWISEDMKTQA